MALPNSKVDNKLALDQLTNWRDLTKNVNSRCRHEAVRQDIYASLTSMLCIVLNVLIIAKDDLDLTSAVVSLFVVFNSILKAMQLQFEFVATAQALHASKTDLRDVHIEINIQRTNVKNGVNMTQVELLDLQSNVTMAISAVPAYISINGNGTNAQLAKDAAKATANAKDTMKNMFAGQPTKHSQQQDRTSTGGSMGRCNTEQMMMNQLAQERKTEFMMANQLAQEPEKRIILQEPRFSMAPSDINLDRHGSIRLGGAAEIAGVGVRGKRQWGKGKKKLSGAAAAAAGLDKFAGSAQQAGTALMSEAADGANSLGSAGASQGSAMLSQAAGSANTLAASSRTQLTQGSNALGGAGSAVASHAAGSANKAAAKSVRGVGKKMSTTRKGAGAALLSGKPAGALAMSEADALAARSMNEMAQASGSVAGLGSAARAQLEGHASSLAGNSINEMGQVSNRLDAAGSAAGGQLAGNVGMLAANYTDEMGEASNVYDKAGNVVFPQAFNVNSLAPNSITSIQRSPMLAQLSPRLGTAANVGLLQAQGNVTAATADSMAGLALPSNAGRLAGATASTLAIPQGMAGLALASNAGRLAGATTSTLALSDVAGGTKGVGQALTALGRLDDLAEDAEEHRNHTGVGLALGFLGDTKKAPAAAKTKLAGMLKGRTSDIIDAGLPLASVQLEVLTEIQHNLDKAIQGLSYFTGVYRAILFVMTVIELTLNALIITVNNIHGVGAIGETLVAIFAAVCAVQKGIAMRLQLEAREQQVKTAYSKLKVMQGRVKKATIELSQEGAQLTLAIYDDMVTDMRNLVNSYAEWMPSVVSDALL